MTSLDFTLIMLAVVLCFAMAGGIPGGGRRT